MEPTKSMMTSKQTVRNVDVGILAEGDGDADVAFSRIADATTGIEAASTDLEVSGTDITRSDRAVLLTESSSNAAVAENDFFDNEVGILLRGSSGHELSSSNLEANDISVLAEAASVDAAATDVAAAEVTPAQDAELEGEDVWIDVGRDGIVDRAGGVAVDLTDEPFEGAEFTIDNIDAPETVDQFDTVSVAADIENAGDLTGVRDVALEVDGDEVDDDNVELAAADDDTVELTYETGAFDVGDATLTVDTGDDTEEHELSVRDLDFEVDIVEIPETADVGETISVTATIENVGGSDGDQTAELQFDGETVDEESVTVDAGAAENVTLTSTVSDENAGSDISVTVTVPGDDDTATVTIEDAADDDDDTGTGTGGGGGGGGAPPSAFDGTGVDVPDISDDLGADAAVTDEFEGIITESAPGAYSATFVPDWPIPDSVTFAVDPLDEVDGTVNARAIEGEPALTGEPTDGTLTITHLSVPDAPDAETMTVRYEIPSDADVADESQSELDLVQFADGEWEQMETSVEQDGETISITAETDVIETSYVAVTEPADDIDDDVAEEPTETDDGIPGFGFAVAVLATIALAMVVRRMNTEHTE